MALVGALAGCNDIFDSNSCSVNGRLYQYGMTFIPADDCNTCTCGSDGRVACTLIACELPLPCAFDTTYTYGFEGGDAVYRDQATLSPPAGYTLMRATSTPDTASGPCSPALPACQDPTKIDPSDIMRDLLQADVQAALATATPPIYGRDDRPLDGPIYGIHRADGRGMLVGSPCATNTSISATACLPIPAGVQQLVDDLRALDAQQRQDASCAAFNPPVRQPASP